jgi:tetratricopeptide (TPR) repeat protein
MESKNKNIKRFFIAYLCPPKRIFRAGIYETFFSAKLPVLIISLLIISTQAFAQDYYKLGCDAQEKANLDQAIVYFTKKIAQDPNFSLAYIKRGLCYQDKADFDLALNDFKKALKLRPGDPAVEMSMGTAYFHLKNFPEALKYLEDAIEKEPNNANAQYDLGMTRHELKDYPGAIKAFNTAILLDPAKDRFYYSRALSKDQIRDYSGAQEDCSAAIKLKPDYEKAYYLRAKEENMLQMYKAAIYDINIVLNMNPGNSRYYAEKADLEYHQGWLDASMKDCIKAISLNDQFGAPFYTKAMVERDSGLIDSALADMAKANDLFRGKSALAWYESGMIKLYAGKYPAAIMDFDNALKIAPNYTYARIMTANALYYSGNDSGAIKVLKQALSMDNNSSIANYLLGRFEFMSQHMPAEPQILFAKAIELNNDSASVALSYAFTGNEEKAVQILSAMQTGYAKQGLLIKQRETDAQFAFIFAVLHNDKRCIDYLDKALSEGYSNKTWISDTREFDFLRNQTAYQALKANYHLGR